MSSEESAQQDTTEYDIADILQQLDRLEQTVDSEAEHREVQQAKKLAKRVRERDYIWKYTSRDIAEGCVGAIVFALPLLVEDGVFEIAEWFVEFGIGPIPLFLVINTVFIIILTAGLLYATDIKEVQINNPIFGIIPRRLLGVLFTSFVVAGGMMLMWGRLHEENPTTLEQFARITVIWAAAALGAVLADILPGESKGTDLSELIGDETEQG